LSDGAGTGRFSVLALRGGAFDRRVVVLEPGEERRIDDRDKCDRLVVVERGEIELECRGGARARFLTGDLLFVDGLSVRRIRNPGRTSALLGTVARRSRVARSVDECGTGGRSNPTARQEGCVMHARTDIAIDELRAAVRGRVIDPHDEGYDEARTPFYGGIDRRPAAIVVVADDRDVARVVTFARESGAELAVRSGGHSVLGHSVSDGGIVLDLREMRAIELDVGRREAWAQTGLTAGEYSKAVGEQGLVTGFGDTGSVGIGGITLGGGVGYLSRRYGLTIDDLLAADVVTADGELRRVDRDSDPDLFWAIRGGGGNVGVATRFRFSLHDLPTVVGGMLLLPATPETILSFVGAAEAAPEELSTIANVMPVPPMPFLPDEVHGRLSIMALMCFAGEPEAGERALAPFRAIATPLADMVRPIPYAEMYPPEDQTYHPMAASRTMFIDAVDTASAATVLEHLQASTAQLRAVQLRVLGGAIGRVPNDATAYAHRDRRIMANVAALYEDPGERSQHEAWVSSLGDAIQRGPEAAYVNFLTGEGPAHVRRAYPGSTYDRLARIKATYDPTNLFRLNQNVPPAEGR
jgi:FAD/FMN-containing dehydrogenase